MTIDIRSKISDAEKVGAVYLDRARGLMIEDGLTAEQADRVVILHALSVIARGVGEDGLPAWLRAEADAIDLHGAASAGSA